MERDRPSKEHSHTGDAEIGTCQNMERNRLSKGHSQTRDKRRRNQSGHGKKLTERGHSRPGDGRGGEHVRTWKEIDQVRSAYSLESAEERTC